MHIPELHSPAQRYALSKLRTVAADSGLQDFRDTFNFELDEFQLTACRAVGSGRGVLLAAPTGAGKTIVGEFAVFLALTRGHKAFYTTPIKALSNQKFQELSLKYGAENVGLLTGDTSINSEAPVVVMTTEVLRNMLYADSDTLSGLAYVVMDEVHYLADRARGAVWEEVIIHLPSEVQLVSLSATVSNAEEFGAWLDTVRGDTAIVVSEHRPIPLWQHVMVGKDIIDLFADDQNFDELGPDSAKRVKVNPELLRLARLESSSNGRRNSRPGHRNQRDRTHGSDRGDRAVVNSVRRASRVQVIRALEAQNLLPAITFIFSRAACDAAVQQCASAGLWLTSPQERNEIADYVDFACSELPDADKDILGYWAWRDGLVRGLAAHHAGMLPVFKEVVEHLFAEGLIRAVFATETLALGINMPARTVVLEKLEKFNGETHVSVTAGEYTQLTGRAGRRGIDVEGHAVVLWQPGTDPSAVAGLASKRSYPLNSSFRPTYNMSMNLLAQFGPERTRKILQQSFAQFQADSSVVDLARQVRSRETSLAGYQEAMNCHLGDFSSYARLRREISDLESGASKANRKQRRSHIAESLANVRPGDIISLGPGLGEAVVLSTDPNLREPRPHILRTDREQRRLSAHDLNAPVTVLGQVRLGKSFNPKVPKDRRNLLAAVENALEGKSSSRPDRSTAFGSYGAQQNNDEIDRLRQELRRHPSHSCPDRELHARWAERWWKLRRETDVLAKAIDQRTNTIAKTFDRVTEVLTHYGFVESDKHGVAKPTEDGQRLRRIYGEKDLLIALAIRHGAFGDLDAAELASFASAVVYQAKRDDSETRPRMPSISLESAVETLIREWSSLEEVEEKHRLPPTSTPDLGLMWPMYKWARGKSLRDSLAGSDLAAGDFVRWTKQVVDLIDQLSKVPGMNRDFSRLCSSAIALIRRGVVAYENLPV